MSNLRKSWNIIECLIGRGAHSSSPIIREFMINGKNVTDNKTISNSFNNYSVNIGNA